jgi:hypothetical protein
MLVTAKCSAILAYILLRGGSKSVAHPAQRLPTAAARSRGDRIDWSAVDHDEADDTATPPSRRMAA